MDTSNRVWIFMGTEQFLRGVSQIICIKDNSLFIQIHNIPTIFCNDTLLIDNFQNVLLFKSNPFSRQTL